MYTPQTTEATSILFHINHSHPNQKLTEHQLSSVQFIPAYLPHLSNSLLPFTLFLVHPNQSHSTPFQSPIPQPSLNSYHQAMIHITPKAHAHPQQPTTRHNDSLTPKHTTQNSHWHCSKQYMTIYSELLRDINPVCSESDQSIQVLLSDFNLQPF